MTLGSETTRLRLVVPLEFFFSTFYGVISMVYKSADHEKASRFAKYRLLALSVYDGRDKRDIA